MDVSSDSVIVQICAKPERITSFMRLCKPFGIIEAARTGKMMGFIGVGIGLICMCRCHGHASFTCA